MPDFYIDGQLLLSLEYRVWKLEYRVWKASITFENSKFKSENPTPHDDGVAIGRCCWCLLLLPLRTIYMLSHALVTVSQRPRILGTRPHVSQESYVSSRFWCVFLCWQCCVDVKIVGTKCAFCRRLWSVEDPTRFSSFFNNVNTLICPHMIMNPLAIFL